MTRRQKRNPGAGLVIAGVTAVAAIVGVAALAFRSKVSPGLPADAPSFVGLPQSEVDKLEVDDCVTAVNGVAGFRVEGVAIGSNVLMKIVQPSRGGSLLARVNDTRLAPGLPLMQVPAGAVSGASTPGVFGC